MDLDLIRAIIEQAIMDKKQAETIEECRAFAELEASAKKLLAKVQE